MFTIDKITNKKELYRFKGKSFKVPIWVSRSKKIKDEGNIKVKLITKTDNAMLFKYGKDVFWFALSQITFIENSKLSDYC